MEELIKLLNDAPLNCGDCEHSVFVRDQYSTGDSPDAYYCDTGCEYLNARDELADEYVNAEYSLSDIDEDSEEFDSISALLDRADKVFSINFGWA